MAGHRLGEDYARQEMLDAGFSPSVPYPGTKKSWPGVCLRCGNPGRPRYGNLRSRATGPCRYCGRQAIDDAVAIGKMMARGFVPRVPYPGCDTPWDGTCAKCGADCSPRYTNVMAGDGACRECGKSGFKASRPTFLYLMERQGEQMVGVTNNPKGRIRKHQARGYESVDWAGPMDGREALAIETAIKRKLRPFILPGTTEEWSTADLEVGTLAELFAWAGVTRVA